jgi:hypothetical protein
MSLLAIAWIVCLIALLLIGISYVKSVLMTGPIIFSLGACAVVLGWRSQNTSMTVTAIMNCGVCILFVTLVNLLHWTPDTARNPFLIMGLIHCLVITVLTCVAARNFRRIDFSAGNVPS